MKRRFFIMILALLALFTCSCEQKPPERPAFEKITSSELAYGEVETGTIPGDYIYRSIDGFLLKYHIPSGTATPVCQDPFCTHERYTSSCRFIVNESQMASIGDMLYYAVENEDVWHLRSYDGDSMQVEEICVSSGVLARLFRYNYYLYFSEILPTKNEGETKTTIYRLDTQNGTTEVINCGESSAIIDCIEAGRIVWNLNGKYLSTDLEGDDMAAYDQMRVREWGKYRLRWELGERTFDKIYCKDLTTDKEVLIAQDIASFYVYGDKLLYFKYAPVRVWTDENGVEIKDRYGGNVYVVNLDGTGDHLLCHVEEFSFMGGSSARNNEFVCGDWVGFVTESYLSLESSPMLSLTNMLLVNVITGEYRLIKYNPYEM